MDLSAVISMSIKEASGKRCRKRVAPNRFHGPNGMAQHGPRQLVNVIKDRAVPLPEFFLEAVRVPLDRKGTVGENDFKIR